MNDVLPRNARAAKPSPNSNRSRSPPPRNLRSEDVRHCEAIGRHGAKLIRNGMKILTHCNAGWLAFVDIGTATAPMYAAQAQGKKFHVFCDETRPRSQGATLTAWELAQQKISHQIIADNAAGHLMQRGEIDLVIVGSDRTLGRTGEVANKIGTYTKAVLAARHKIPFYVAIPLSTIDWNLKRGFDIPIEERSESEVLGAWGMSNPKSNPKPNQRAFVRVANPTSGARNPGFDVTPRGIDHRHHHARREFSSRRNLWKQRRQTGFCRLSARLPLRNLNLLRARNKIRFCFPVGGVAKW